MDKETLTEMMDRDRYMGAKEAKQFSLIDQIVENRKNKAKGQKDSL